MIITIVVQTKDINNYGSLIITRNVIHVLLYKNRTRSVI